VAHDLEQMHTALRELVKRAGLPELPPLQSASLRGDGDESSPADVAGTASCGATTRTARDRPRSDDPGHSRDNSPKMSAADQDLPYVPIQSLYALTKLRALRSPDDVREKHEHQPEQRQQQEQRKPRGADISGSGNGSSSVDDFIARGAVELADAERLFGLFRDRLDAFMYGVGCRYKTLEETRRRSTALTAAVLTVAALHDAQSDGLYGVCRAEFRALMERSMFERRIDRDDLRAMCVAAYWLSDMSWMLSGYAIRRAAEMNLHTSHARVIAEHSQEAADCARVWYILYICDQHLATLYGRPSIVQEDASVQNCEIFLESPASNDEDKRLLSQVALLNITRSVRDLFGPDKGEPIPRVYLNQVAHFNRQLDQWLAHWTTIIKGKFVWRHSSSQCFSFFFF
jgi:hypothetical protein